MINSIYLVICRYLATHTHLSHLRTQSVGQWLCLAIWMFSLLLTLPYWIYARAIKSAPNSSRHSCRLQWPRENLLAYRKSWNYIQLSLGLLVPFFLICLAYVLMIKRLRDVTKVHNKRRKEQQQRLSFMERRPPHSKRLLPQDPASRMTILEPIKKPDSDESSPDKEVGHNRSRFSRHTVTRKSRSNVTRVQGRMTRTVIGVVVTFLICHVPYYVMQQAGLYIHERRENDGRVPTSWEASLFVYCNVIAQIMLFLNSCCNPIIYGLLNQNYSKYIIVIE